MITHTNSKDTLTLDNLKMEKRMEKELKFTMRANGKLNQNSLEHSKTTSWKEMASCIDKMDQGKKGSSLKV
jgi:hypothetical protein